MIRIESIIRCQATAVLCALVLLTAGTPSVMADQEDSYTELDYLSDIPDVVSATRMSQKLTQAPAAVTLITRKMIDAAPVYRIEDLFRLVPGMQTLSVSHNTWMVAYHGVTDNFPDNLEIMVDGRSIYLPFLSTVDWNSLGLSLDDIDHIEVVRGSNVPAYGSNAFLGAINIVTRSPLTESGSSASALVGSDQQQIYEVRHADFNEHFSYRLSAGYRSNDGSDLYSDSQRQRYTNLSVSLAPSLTDTVDVQLGLVDGDIYTGSADKLDQRYVPREHSSNYQYLRWNRVLDASQDLQLTYSRNDFDVNTPYETAEQLLLRSDPRITSLAQAQLAARAVHMDGVKFWSDAENGESTSTELELQYVLNMADNLDGVIGTAYRRETARSEPVLGHNGLITEERSTLFGNVQWRQNEQLIWNLGGMVEHFSSISATRASPRVAVNYLVSEDTVVRAAYTRAYRMPSLIDPIRAYTVYNNQGDIWDVISRPNNELKPERLDSWEVGGFWRADSGVLEADVRFYYEDISDGIEERFYLLDPPDIDAHYSRIENISSWYSKGVDLQLRYHPGPDTTAWLAYGYQDVNGGYYRGQKRVDDAGEGLRLTVLDSTSPQHTLSLLVSQQFAEDWAFSVAEYYMSDVLWKEGGQRESWWRTDLKLAKTWNADRHWQLEAALIAQNVFESQNEEFYPYNLSDRSIFLQLKVKER